MARRSCVCRASLFFVCLTFPLHAQARLLQPADYGRWETLGAAALSPNGQWLAYGVNRVNEEGELRIRATARDTTRVVPLAAGPVFSADSRWLGYAIGVAPAERDRLVAEKKAAQNRAGLLDIATGTSITVEHVSAFRFSGNARFIAMRGYAAEGTKRDAADLLVRDLASGTTVTFGNVGSFAWSDRGALLAFTVETETGSGNGVQLFDATTGRNVSLHSSGDRYRALAWRKNASDLAALHAQPTKEFRDTAYVAMAWTALDTPSAAQRELQLTAVPAGMRVTDGFTPVWAKDGSRIFVGLRPREAAEPQDTATKEKRSDVQVWHAKDVRIIPQQKAQEPQDTRRAIVAAWQRDGTLTQLGTDLVATTQVVEGDAYFTESSARRYPFGAMFGRSRSDITVADARTGTRRAVADSVRFFFGASATGRYLLSYKGSSYFAYDLTTGRTINLTARAGAIFADHEYDTPTDELPPYGVAGWTADDRAVLVYDRYDIWWLAADGATSQRLTSGASDSVVHRVVHLNRDDRGIDLARPVWLSLVGSWSKKSGYGVLRSGRVERLVFADARVTRLIRADSMPTFAYTKERFDDSPDWFVGGEALGTAAQVSATNPFLKDVAWGRSELTEFTSAAGVRLQGSLHYPANYDPARKYPMIVRTYEILSTNVHNWSTPSEREYYNLAVWTQRGYFVLQPDIVFRSGDPGRSVVDAVVPAVRAIVARGLVDSTKIGMTGHSWGGYEATYLPTQTNIFAASVAGAPITNFLSFAGAIHWTPGFPELDHWETGQARMASPPWESFDAHVRNSPAAFVQNLRTPMLMEVGDADGTVDWHQGLEFYNYARRAGRKDFVLLMYPGEDHGLRKKENQVDYHRRILEWFGYYLKGEPAPAWMMEGVAWKKQG